MCQFLFKKQKFITTLAKFFTSWLIDVVKWYRLFPDKQVIWLNHHRIGHYHKSIVYTLK